MPTLTKFLTENVLPASKEDKFYDPKCPICWDTYDTEHPAVRILPCNHIFGRECLVDYINNGASGHCCMMCQTLLFRPALWTMVCEWIEPWVEPMLDWVCSFMGWLLFSTFFSYTEDAENDYYDNQKLKLIVLSTTVLIADPRQALNTVFLQTMASQAIFRSLYHLHISAQILRKLALSPRELHRNGDERARWLNIEGTQTEDVVDAVVLALSVISPVVLLWWYHIKGRVHGLKHYLLVTVLAIVVWYGCADLSPFQRKSWAGETGSNRRWKRKYGDEDIIWMI
jgi:hypothetical protein